MSRLLVIEARYYQHINDFLLEGVRAALEKHGVEFDVLSVPGALEIPAALNMSLDKGYDAFVVTGCIIRGETSHYDIVCNESARGVYELVLEHSLALGNAILTVEDEEQALERARSDRKDKGGDAAMAALRMLEIKNAQNTSLMDSAA